MEDVKCIGCGAIIQTKDKAKPGYVDKKIMDKEEGFYCKRCFSIRHYNKNNAYELSSDEAKDIIDEIKSQKGLICLVVDAFDFEGTIIPHINTLFNTNNVLLVLNKADLFIRDLNLNKLINYVRSYLKKKNIKVVDIAITSGKEEKIGLNDLIEKVNLYRKGKNAFFVGMSNVGKSTLINNIIYDYTNEKDVVTVSNCLNTTLGNIYIPLDKKSYIIDTPGIINHNNLMYYIKDETLKKIMPNAYIKPRVFQLNPLQTLFISGFMRIDFKEGEKSSFVTNFNNNVIIHRCKLETADEFYDKHLDDILLYPSIDERKNMGAFTFKTYELKKNEKIEVAMAGLGYVSISGIGKIEIKYFSKIKVVIRKAIF